MAEVSESRCVVAAVVVGVADADEDDGERSKSAGECPC